MACETVGGSPGDRTDFEANRLDWLRGAYDLHVHSAPDLMERSVDDLGLAREAVELGMAGIVLKSHYAPTAERAWLIRQLYPELFVGGALVLNHFVGGLNPAAVEAFARAGGLIVFMPTSDAANEAGLLDAMEARGEALPPYLQIKAEMRDRGRLRPPISLLDGSGRLSTECHDVLDVVEEHQLILATGHIGWEEMSPLVQAAHQLGINRVVVTHPESPSIDLTVEQQQTLAADGALFERCFAYLRDPDRMTKAAEAIRATGVDRNVISSDLGAPGMPLPPEGLVRFMELLVQANLSEKDVLKMTRENPARLVSGR